MRVPILLDQWFTQRLTARVAHGLALRVDRMRWSILAALAVGVVLWAFALIGLYSVARAANARLSGAHAAELGIALGLPEFPGATLSEFREEVFGDERLTEIEYLVDSAVPEVQAHYQAAFARGGWTVTDTKWVHGEWVYTMSRGARRAIVEIEHRDGVTEVEVELTEPLGSRDDVTNG